MWTCWYSYRRIPKNLQRSNYEYGACRGWRVSTLIRAGFSSSMKEEDSGEVFRSLLNKERFSQVVGRYNLTWFDADAGEYNENAIDIYPKLLNGFVINLENLCKA